MPRVPQVRRIIFNDEEIGMGFNSESGLAVGTALHEFTIQENPTASGQEVTASITIVNSHEELQETLGMSFEAQGRYGFFSASAKAKFSEKTNFNSTSTFLIANVVVKNPLRRGKNFKVTDEAKALLDSNRFVEFKAAFGDSFIRGLQTGGEFYSVVRITSVSTTKQTELAATLQAEANGLVAGGSFSASFAQANSSSSTRSEFTATMYQKAGAGDQISPTVEISEVIARFKNFPAIAAASAAAYETEVATYDTLPLPVPTPEEQEAFLLALADAREKKLRYIQTRNDLEFALRNPSFFEALPANDVLMNAISVYTKLINAVIAHAIQLSRGQITPPQLFDPAALSSPITEPAPIPLNRAQPDPRIHMPNLIGIDTFDLDYALRNLGIAPIDQIISGTVPGNPPIETPITISREALEFLLLTTEAGGKVVRLSSNSTPTSHFAKHRIVAQTPPTGSPVDRGSEVDIRIEPA